MRHHAIHICIALTLCFALTLTSSGQNPDPAEQAPVDETQVEETPAPREPVKVERARIVPFKPAGAPKTEPAPSPPVPSGPITSDLMPQGPVRPGPVPVDARPGHHAVREVRLIKEGGGRVEGARQGDWIAFDMIGADERYDVFIMNIEGGSERCLTCDYWEFRKTHVLNPAWHPSGEVLIVQVQSQPLRRRLSTLAMTTPHRALGSELWAVTRDGKAAVQITRFGERGSAVLDPHFSHEAGLLVWSERLRSREGGPWGQWGLRVTELKVGRGIARLGKSRLYDSGLGTGLAVAHDFSPDDGGLLVSASPDRGLAEMDILRLDLETEEVVRLTSSPDQHDELVSSVPHSDYYVWVTDRGLDDPRLTRGAARGPLPRRTEVWLRSASGMAQERLTYFNNFKSDHYLGQAMVTDVSWTADGEALLLQVLSVPERSLEVKQAIFLVRLGKEYRR